MLKCRTRRAATACGTHVWYLCRSPGAGRCPCCCPPLPLRMPPPPPLPLPNCVTLRAHTVRVSNWLRSSVCDPWAFPSELLAVLLPAAAATTISRCCTIDEPCLPMVPACFRAPVKPHWCQQQIIAQQNWAEHFFAQREAATGLKPDALCSLVLLSARCHTSSAFRGSLSACRC